MRCTVGDFRLDKIEKAAINDVLESGRLSEGKRVYLFEKKWAEFVGTKHCVATSSGSGALITGLTALKYLNNYAPGTKVITTPLTYIATSSAVNAVGFEPVYVDVDPHTFNITPENIFKLIQSNTSDDFKIILPVHLMGYPADMEGINQIAAEYGLAVFEDAAQAHGTMLNGKKTGSMSDLADFSFYIAHNIQAGEMGALTTNNTEIMRLARKIKTQGRECDCPVCTRNTGNCRLLDNNKDATDYDPRFSHDLIGFNFKAMEFQAALALTQLERADWIIKRRQANVRYLNEALAEVSELLQLPAYNSNVSYLAYPIVIKRQDKVSRKEIRAFLHLKGIETRPLFGCIPTQQPAYRYLKFAYKNKLPVAEHLGRDAFYIGCHQYLNEDNLDFMAKTIIKACRGGLRKKYYLNQAKLPHEVTSAG